MRQNRRPGERLFVDYAGMTVPLLIDKVEHVAQVFVASTGVSGRLYVEATLTQKIEDWCASHLRCFEDMGWAPQLVVPDNLKSAVTQPLSRYEPVLNETDADLLDHYGVQGLPARVWWPRDKGLVGQGVIHAERRVLAPLRNHVFHDLASLNRAIAAQVRKINDRPNADGAGKTGTAVSRASISRPCDPCRTSTGRTRSGVRTRCTPTTTSRSTGTFTRCPASTSAKRSTYTCADR